MVPNELEYAVPVIEVKLVTTDMESPNLNVLEYRVESE